MLKGAQIFRPPFFPLRIAILGGEKGGAKHLKYVEKMPKGKRRTSCPNDGPHPLAPSPDPSSLGASFGRGGTLTKKKYTILSSSVSRSSPSYSGERGIKGVRAEAVGRYPLA